jgi:hypothetical protein
LKIFNFPILNPITSEHYLVNAAEELLFLDELITLSREIDSK